MSTWTKIAIGTVGTVALITLVLGIRRTVVDRRIERTEQALHEQALRVDQTGGVFTEDMVDGLPAPAQRYFRHAIQPGTRLAQGVRLDISGRMKPREDAAPITLSAEETLAPPQGFVWTARLRMGFIPLQVRDHYARGNGAVSVHALRLVPISHDENRDVNRSSRDRLAGESIWLPSALLPHAGARWEAVDETHARVEITIDGEAIPLTLHIDEAGHLREVTMMRYGDVGVDTWQPISYGFAVEEERTFEGYTIPSVIQGGWWYGTDRYDPQTASRFHIREASFY